MLHFVVVVVVVLSPRQVHSYSYWPDRVEVNRAKARVNFSLGTPLLFIGGSWREAPGTDAITLMPFQGPNTHCMTLEMLQVLGTTDCEGTREI